jgi:hypothetical protein
VFRALEGALAVWRETERSLRLGLAASAPEVKAKIEPKLATIELATRSNVTRKLQATTSQAGMEAMVSAHADAGVLHSGIDGGAVSRPAPPPR